MDTKKPVKVEPKEVATTEFGFQFPMFKRFARDLEWLVDRFPRERFFFEPEPSMWAPDIEVVERGNELVVTADLPGIKKEEISVEVTDNELVLRGERKKEKEEKGEGYYRSERTYGSFYRTIPLPEGVKIEQAKALVHDGVLEVKMPLVKIEEKRRRLEIQESATGEKPAKHAA